MAYATMLVCDYYDFSGQAAAESEPTPGSRVEGKMRLRDEMREASSLSQLAKRIQQAARQYGCAHQCLEGRPCGSPGRRNGPETVRLEKKKKKGLRMNATRFTHKDARSLLASSLPRRDGLAASCICAL